MDNETQLNIFNETIEECGCSPLTGFFRTGCCETSDVPSIYWSTRAQ